MLLEVRVQPVQFKSDQSKTSCLFQFSEILLGVTVSHQLLSHHWKKISEIWRGLSLVHWHTVGEKFVMSVRTVHSPLHFRPSSSQTKDTIHKPHPPSYYSTYGSKTSRLNGETSTRRPLPKGPGPLDDRGRKLRLNTDYNSNLTSTTSSFRPKKSSLPSSLGTSTQPVKATHGSEVVSYKYTSKYLGSRETSPSYGLSRTGSQRSRSISDLSRDVSRLHLDDSPLKSSYKETSFGNVSDRIERTSLLNYRNNNSHAQRAIRYSEPSSSRNSYLSSPSSSSYRFSRQDSYPTSRTSDSETPSPRDYSRSSSRTRKLNRSSSLLSPLNNSSRYSTDKEGLVGLSNLGNTCFLNAIVQCLSHINSLLEYCLKEDYHLDLNTESTTKGQLIQAYAQVMNHLWKPNGDRYFSPRQFKSQVEKFARQFAGYSQQDAQEFLRFLLEGLHEDVNAVKKKPRYNTEISEDLSDIERAKEAWQRYKSREQSHISDLFVGQLKSTLECCTCGFKSTTFDPFWDLSLPIPRDQTSVTLNDCLKHFTRSEVLDEEDKPMCAHCKSRQACTKTLSIQRFPQILVIHLKRFSGRSKLSTFVDFPVERLNLQMYAADSCLENNFIYNLHGTVNHFGSIYGGHYVAVCKHAKQQKWHRYDDERVETVSSSTIKSSQAYVLFYEQDGVKTAISHL